MHTTPFFSVVIPTYNRAEQLRKTLESVLAQQFSDFEIIVVDDGSKDPSEGVCQSLDDARIVYHWQENAGPAVARNQGKSLAQGKYIAYLDSDDKWHPEYLKAAAEQLNNLEEQSFLYGQIVVDRGLERYWIKPACAKLTEESIYDYLYLQGGFMQTSTLIVPKNLADKVSWNPKLTFGDNDQYAIDLCNSGGQPVIQPKALVWYLDICADDALSHLYIHDAQSQRYQNFFTWMQEHYDNMSVQAKAGFEAHFLSGIHAWQAPNKSWSYLWRAQQCGAISFKGIIRQLLQNYAPKLYRRLVNRYVSFRGLTAEETPFACTHNSNT